MLNSLPGIDPARRDRLIDVLDIDPAWRMHLVSGAGCCPDWHALCWLLSLPLCMGCWGLAIKKRYVLPVYLTRSLLTCCLVGSLVTLYICADGQRRRVQIAMGLLKPFKVLLLDEITVDLDVLGRADLMTFLRDECRERGATIIYVRGTLCTDCCWCWQTACFRVP